MTPKISIKVTNTVLYLAGDIDAELQKEIQTRLSYVVPGFKFMPRYKEMLARAEETGRAPEWDGTKTIALMQYDGQMKAPTGLFSYIWEILAEKQIPVELIDRRLPATKSEGWSTTCGVANLPEDMRELKLRDYQQEVSDAGLNKQRGVMKVSTGGGKTEITVDMIIRAGAFPAMYYVPSCDLLEQAYDRFRMYCLHKGIQAKIGRIGAGHCDIQPITIATVQSCERALTGKFTKYDFDDVDEDDETAFNAEQKRDICELVREAQFVYVDECQHTSAETIQTVLGNSYKARYRIGGSASPWRDDGLDILIEACFGRKFCDVTASFLIQQGYLIKPHIIFNHFRHYLGKAATFGAHYKQFVSENSARNLWIAKRAQFHVERNRPTFIIVKWSKHAEILLEEINKLFKGCEVLTSSGKHKLSPAKRKKILEKMRTREIMCCIGTSLLDEGVDVPVATAGIMAGGGKSSTRALQRVGRLIRPDPSDPQKDTAYIEEIYDHCRWLDLHAKARRRIYQTESEFFIGDNRDTLVL